MCHELFSNIPQQHLEATLDGLIHHTTWYVLYKSDKSHWFNYKENQYLSMLSI